MTITILAARSVNDMDGMSELTRQYLEWDLREFERVSGMRLDLGAYVSNTLDHLDEYLPPDGRMFLARDPAGGLVGSVLLKRLNRSDGEVKRLYVTPEGRGSGLGKRLVEMLVQEAVQIGYRTLFLDTASYMPAAHQIYRSCGFVDTDPYTGSENDKALRPYLMFMRRDLD